MAIKISGTTVIDDSRNIINAGNLYVSGNLGIGTTNPTAKLDVAGIVSATAYYGDGSQLSGVSGGFNAVAYILSI